MSAQDDKPRDDMSALFDYAVAHPKGFTRYDVARDLDWGNVRLSKAAREVRMTLGDDSITLTCNPQGCREAWLYQLVGTLEEANPYIANRMGDAETRLESLASMLATIINGSDGRSRSGRRARVLARHIDRAREDLVALDEFAE